jgi:20S proteasome subunit beta 5
MLAGCDKTGPNLYYLDQEGHRFKGNMFSVGSGSSYAYSVIDTHYKFDMTVE